MQDDLTEPDVFGSTRARCARQMRAKFLKCPRWAIRDFLRVSRLNRVLIRNPDAAIRRTNLPGVILASTRSEVCPCLTPAPTWAFANLRRISSAQACGDAAWVPAGRRRLCREAVAGQQRQHEIERVLRASAVCGRVRERADDLEQLDDRAV